MPFSQDVKAKMFIRCARLCCLCLKQCGTNIEAAHIVAEADGGLNDEDNGIPACMDCHTEISHYDPRQPKGNKFTHKELRARRDQVYKLVDSGALFAQIVASRTSSATDAPQTAPVPSPAETALSTDATRLLNSIKAGKVRSSSITAKLDAIGADQRALVIDKLASECDDSNIMASLGGILRDPSFLDKTKQVLVEQMCRKAILFDSPEEKKAFLDEVPVEALCLVEEGTRSALFRDLISIIKADQYEEVNEVVPAIKETQASLPPSLAGEYIDALLEQCNSGAWRGAPAAKRLLESFPDELAPHALEQMTLCWRSGKSMAMAKQFIKRYQSHWPNARKKQLRDYIAVKWETFVRRHGDPETGS